MFTSWLRQRKSDRAQTKMPASAPPVRRSARVPDGQRIYAIGDIHGRAALLQQLQQQILADDSAKGPAETRLIYLGDYIDRGAESRKTIEMLLSPAKGLPFSIHLRGNHEQMLLDCIDDPARLQDWRHIGGLETLMSYGVEADLLRARTNSNIIVEAFEERCRAHLPFFRSLDHSARFGDYFFCHAGVRPGVPLHLQSPQDLMWIRQEFLGSPSNFGAMIVHGHTPVEKPDIRANRINIDTGAYATRVLTAIVLERDEVDFLST